MINNKCVNNKAILALLVSVMMLVLAILFVAPTATLSKQIQLGGNVDVERISKMADVDNSEFVDIEDITYTGQTFMPAIQVGNYIENDDFKVAYNRNGAVTHDFQSVGAIEVIVTMLPPHSGVLTQIYNILPRVHSFDPAPTVKSTIANGKEQKPDVVMSDGFNEGYHYELSYYRGEVATLDFINSGIIIIKVTMINNHSGSYELVYNIMPSSINGKLPIGEYAVINSKGFTYETTATLTEITESQIDFSRYIASGDEILIYYKLEIREGTNSYNSIDSFYLRLPKPSKITNASYAKIIYNERGNIRNKSCEVEGNYMVININSEGEFAIVLTNPKVVDKTNLAMPIVVTVGVFLIVVILATFFFAFRKSGSRNIHRK